MKRRTALSDLGHDGLVILSLVDVPSPGGGPADHERLSPEWLLWLFTEIVDEPDLLFCVEKTQGRVGYVQGHVHDGRAVWLEAQSNAFRSVGDELREDEEQALVALGWEAPNCGWPKPTVKGTWWPNFHREWPESCSVSSVASLAWLTLANVFGAEHAGDLELQIQRRRCGYRIGDQGPEPSPESMHRGFLDTEWEYSMVLEEIRRRHASDRVRSRGACPSCGARAVVPIVYGLPAPPYGDEEPPDVFHAGCLLPSERFEKICLDCHLTFNPLPPITLHLPASAGPNASGVEADDDEARADLVCARCGSLAGSIVLKARRAANADPFSSNEGMIVIEFPGVGTEVFPWEAFSHLAPMREVGLAIARQDLAALERVSWLLAPYWCERCDACYCAREYATEVIYEPQFGIDGSLMGKCPAGHEHFLRMG